MAREYREAVEVPEEISTLNKLSERVGKVRLPETYFNSLEFLIMLPNDYSLLVKKRGSSNSRADVTVYYGMGDVTLKYFKSKRAATRVSRKFVEGLIFRLESEKIDV